MAIFNLAADTAVFTSNTYLAVEGPRTLVDPGAIPGVVDAIRERIPALDAVVLTHQHDDHVAQLDSVVAAFDPAVYAYADHPLRTDPIEDGDSIQIGAEAFTAVHTPGHADDHVAFVSETTLFSGDLVVYDDGAFTGGSFGRTDGPGQSRSTLIESIDRLLDRLPASVEYLYAGHGGPFQGDVRSIVTRALERAERREPKYPEE
ncbi:MBL fold metallo-hydrolase [Halanaeroarchaeum sulfurireducens]|uniref:Hydroxyacylglutathione hydrolase n=1 Tax=Halanaeroarchaeum sulfurireducens TaxID=1604004 RepID=A0A0F7PBC3_9EURY|nr:MBL fold metallo-hydrolase [Halanaeroarchaeum sulfurireducens]AKH98466.1 hydroxyacylglutathione hydrolase [Halanaeroarchaeum sulfurireducens]ALG82860.1 hydroxyacylglutathione hydrolase [Halanaeroarchaeum sulfurireducens]